MRTAIGLILLLIFAVSSSAHKFVAIEAILTPERCSELSPDQASDLVFYGEQKIDPTYSCEAGIDSIYRIYEKQLEKYNNKKCPQSKIFRPQVKGIFLAIVEAWFTMRPSGSGGLHSSERSGAWAEWYLLCWQGKDYKSDDTAYQAKDIETMLRIMAQASSNYAYVEHSNKDREREIDKSIKEVMRKVAALNNSIEKDQQSFVNGVVMRYLGQYL
jgi:hypothetical protein